MQKTLSHLKKTRPPVPHDTAARSQLPTGAPTEAAPTGSPRAPPAPIGALLRTGDHNSQSAPRCRGGGRCRMAAEEENGQAAEPEAAAEEPRSFKDLVRPGWSRCCPRFCLSCRHIRPGVGRSSHSAVCRAGPHAGPPCLSPRGAALGCGPGPIGAAGARGTGTELCPGGRSVPGVEASASVRVAFPLPSVLLGRPPVFSHVFICPGVFPFSC